MVAGELAHGRGLYLAGIGLGVFDQFSETLERALFTDDQNIRIEYEAAKRIKLFRFVARLALGAQHGLEHDMGEIHAADIVPVRLRADQPRPADFPARAGLVGYDDGLRDDTFGEFLDEPMAQVAAAARVECGHEHDRLGGVFRHRREREAKTDPQSKQ